MSGGFLYPRTPADPINRMVGYTVRGGIEAGGQMKCPRTAGLGYSNKNSAVARVAPFFSGCKYLERFLNRGWTLLCGAGVVYEPQLAKASTLCGVVSTRGKSVFVPGLLELMGYGRISGTAVEPYPHLVRRNTPRSFAGLSPPRVSLALRAAQPFNDKPMLIYDCRTIMGSCVNPRRNRLSSPICQDF